jgi:hypothetical protein
MNDPRKTRVADFKRRAAYAPHSVYHHRSCGWPYIPVYYFADETDQPVDSTDCWCLLGEDAALLECCVADASESLTLYARVDREKPFWPKLIAKIPPPLTRAAVEHAMQKFVELGFPDPLLSKLVIGQSVQLTP